MKEIVQKIIQLKFSELRESTKLRTDLFELREMAFDYLKNNPGIDLFEPNLIDSTIKTTEYDCGCPTDKVYVCGNSACPRSLKITIS